MKESINNLVTDWLIHSYLYYVLGQSVITDGEFDYIAEQIKKNWSKIEHRHKYLLDKDFLKSAYYLPKSKYPEIIKSCAQSILSGKIECRRYLKNIK